MKEAKTKDLSKSPPILWPTTSPNAFTASM
jgi:hypothetical protein